MNLVPLFARRNEPGEDHTYDAFFDRKRVANFEFGIAGIPSERLACCGFPHSSIVAEIDSCLGGMRYFSLRRTGDCLVNCDTLPEYDCIDYRPTSFGKCNGYHRECVCGR